MSISIVTPLALLALFGAIGAILALDSRRRRDRDAADELEAARLRLTAAGEDPDAATVFQGPTSGVYTSRHAVDTTPPLDQRTTAIVVDPTLTADEVADVIEHIAPGAGSLSSFAAASYDTAQMRTGAELHEIEVAYDEAFRENVERTFNTAVGGWWKTVDNAWDLIDAWVAKYHGEEHYANCVHCAEVHQVHSDEYALIVEQRIHTHTGEISKADIEALYALHGATT